MQVSCGNCQLSFDAPEGASGLVCPICRGPLLPKSADGASPAAKAAQDWSGGDLDDLIAILSAPALSARVEVLGASGDAAIGEVHLLAGGVSDALFGGKSTDDSLDKLRAAKPTRFRVEQRLPNPTDGDLTYPGADAGTLESRALAHLMRYCEDYVITCMIEVWRGNENAKVEYKRGEIGNVTVGGIDAPERLAEVMQWSSGNYRLMVQPLKLPAVAPKKTPAVAAAPAKVPAPAPSAQAARHASATKTIFGMPAAEIIKARAAAEAAKAATSSPARTTTPTSASAQPPAASAAPPAAAPAKTTPPAAAPSAAAAPAAATARVATPAPATKTIFGVPTPGASGSYTPVTQPSATAAAAPAAQPQAASPAPTAVAGTMTTDDRAKTGARKTALPGPEVAAASADDPAATQSGYGAAAAAAVREQEKEKAKEKEKEKEQPKRASTPMPAAAAKAVPAAAAAAASEKVRAPRRETPIWTYVGVGVIFGAVLIGIYQLVGWLAH
ncbi:MAG TPA: hypothetical protein VIF57_10135 [Polyangia bacterium]|jgi:hypothetical protein